MKQLTKEISTAIENHLSCNDNNTHWVNGKEWECYFDTENRIETEDAGFHDEFGYRSLTSERRFYQVFNFEVSHEDPFLDTDEIIKELETYFDSEFEG